MSNPSFSFFPFDFSGNRIIQADYNPVPDHEKTQAKMQAKPADNNTTFFSMEELGQVHPLSSDQFGVFQSNKGEQQKQHQDLQMPLTKSNCLTLDEYLGSCFAAPAVHPMKQIKISENITSHPFSLSSSLDLLNNYGGGIKKLNLNQFNDPTNPNNLQTRKKLSTEEIMRIAGARYIQFSDQNYDNFAPMHPFGYALSGLSDQETRDVELAHLLLAAAEKVGCQQYDRASRLLSRCEWIAFERSNPVQRVVFCFAEALREKIDKTTGNFVPKDQKGSTKTTDIPHGLSTNIAGLTFVQKVPFNQISQLASIQCILENIGSTRKLHVIDLEIRSGVQWTAMMQALLQRENRPLENLRVTAVGNSARYRQLEETGKSLESFANSMNLAFKYKVICVSCPSEIKEELFEISNDEALVVVSNVYIRTLIWKPECLENLMRVIKNLNPSLLLVSEVEANHNSPVFVSRFIEALFFYSAYFDCLEVCMDQNLEEKSVIEATFSYGIREIVALPDSDRIARSVKIDVWRAFFRRFRMVEIGFSEACLYQASLVPKQFGCGNLCSVDKNGKCLLVGWKGTPLHSLSAWKFSRDRLGRFSANYRF